MKLKKSICILSLLFFSISIFFEINTTTVLADDSPTIYCNVDKNDIVAGEEFTVTILANNVKNLYGASVDFKYDSSIMTPINATSSCAFNNDHKIYEKITQNDYSNNIFSFITTFLGDYNGTNFASGSLFNIKFKAKRSGSLNLNRESLNIKLSDSNANPIKYNMLYSTINIGQAAKINSINSNVKNNLAIVDNNISINTNATSKYPVLYKYWIKKDDSPWTVLSDYSNKSSIDFNPKSPGNYQISCYVKTNNTYEDPSDFKIFNFKVLEKPSITKLNINESTINLGGKINISTDSNKNNTLFKIWVLENNSWKILQDYSPNNTIDYSPKLNGLYKISVYAKSPDSLSELDDCKIIDFEVLPNATLKVDKNFYTVNNTVNLFTETDSSNDLIYKYWMNENGIWKTLSDYTNLNTFSLSSLTPGDKLFAVYVKNKNSNNDNLALAQKAITIVDPKLTIANSNLDNNISINDEIKIGLTSNIKNPKYKFWIMDSSCKWKVLQDYGDNNILSYIPKEYGNYKLSIYLKDKDSQNEVDDYKILDFSIKPKLSTFTANPNNNSFVYTPIKLTASTKNSTSDLLYKFWVKDSKGWKMIRDYDTNPSFDWIPTSPGNYIFSVYVKNKNSASTVDDNLIIQNYVVADNTIKDISLNKLSNEIYQVNTTVDNSNNLLYKFWYFNGTDWKVLNDYSIDASIKTKNLDFSSGKISVYIKNKNSKNEYDNFKIVNLKDVKLN
ncbi:Y_Y_Y domain-containing protein [Clostridium cavendishii DSM 21758]|uniref:Y_Y_Y domain-containing protein n=1 Tax=Clostridium cavendishii DSM 21758 TaxID=1121302 RepID=A0A1M6Q8C6_9CLOT|nr:triple tyrosine motif-containing protein [Clostridium cavendishii]SHK16406.1 Y_Y_Y domain-containing protein [Clostridium cavendishii DSM 21758]